MENPNTKILAQKEKLAANVLQVAEDALEDIKVTMAEASVKDLIAIFNSSVKAHKDLMQDIISIQDRESSAEESLAKEYDSKVDELIKKISGGTK
jgi:hypothetical protein